MDEKIARRRDFLISLAYFSSIVLIIYLVFRYALSLVLPFIIAFILVAFLTPLARKLNKKLNIKTEILSFALMLLMYIVVAVLLFLLILQITNWVQTLYYEFPGYYHETIKPSLTHAWTSVQGFIDELPETIVGPVISFQESLSKQLDAIIDSLSDAGISKLKQFAPSIPSFFVAFIFTIMLSFFISLQYDKIKAFFALQLPESAKIVVKDLRSIIFVSVGQYAKALLTLMFITFVELSVGLIILQVPYSVLVAAGIAVLDALPVFGTGTVLIPWVIIELFQSNFKMAIGLLILYGVISLVRNIIEPKIVGDRLGLNPVVSLVSIYLGFKLFGVLGMIFMPIAIQILIELQKKGTITLYREAQKVEEENGNAEVAVPVHEAVDASDVPSQSMTEDTITTPKEKNSRSSKKSSKRNKRK